VYQAYFSDALLVRPPRCRTSPTSCSFVLIYADIHSDMWQGLLLVPVACPASFSLAYFSHALLLCSPPRRPISRTPCLSAFLVGLLLRVACLVSSLAYFLNALFVYPPCWPASTRCLCSLLASLLLECVGCPPCTFSLAYFYVLLVWRNFRLWGTACVCCSFALIAITSLLLLPCTYDEIWAVGLRVIMYI
jgi:hypothetical protein